MGCPQMYPWKNRNQRISEVGKDLSDHGVQGMAEHSTVWEQIPAHPCMTLLIPRREELMAALTFPSHPNTSGPREPPGIFPVTPQIFYNRKSCSKKSPLATFPKYSHFGPSRNAAGATLLRER